MSDDDNDSIGRGGLADQLAGLDIDAPDKKDEDDEASDVTDAGTSSAEPTRGASESTPRPSQQEQQLTDEELFEQAIAEVSPEEVQRAKNPRHQRKARASREIGQTDQADQLPDEDALPEADEGTETAQSQRSGPAKKPSERELFEQAVSDIGPEDVYRGKFEGRGAELPAEPEDEPKKAPGVPGQAQDQRDDEDEPEVDEEAAREKLGELREFRQFEKAVGPVDQDIERDKYRDRTSRRDPQEDVERRLAYRSDSPDEMITPPLPKSGEGLNNVGPLAPAQKDMLERFEKRLRRDEVLKINVRGDTVEDALRQVELFIHQRWKEHARFCRIIHGRGLQSEGDPVLKPAILRWLEGPGFRYIRGYAPEVNNAGDYGSIVVELAERHEDR